MVSKKEIYNDIKFCKDLMDRLLVEANSYKTEHRKEKVRLEL